MAKTMDWPGKQNLEPFGFPELTPDDFRRLRELVLHTWGIHLADGKKVMVEGRLRPRLQKLGFSSFHEYCAFLFSPKGMQEEMSFLIDRISTQKTDFFRESEHFAFLARALPNLCGNDHKVLPEPVHCLIAGCSTGEEAYSLAMVLAEFFGTSALGRLKRTILAVDASLSALTTAKRGVYSENRIQPVSLALRQKYLLRSKDPARLEVKFIPDIRRMIIFEHLNLMTGESRLRESFPVIFCRNVLIYFPREIQEKMIRWFWSRLSPGGYLFLGHSEAILGIDIPFKLVAPTVYHKASGSSKARS